jgi:hypothetical protein
MVTLGRSGRGAASGWPGAEFDRRACTVTLSGQNVDIGPVPPPDGSTPLPIAARSVEFEGSTIDQPAGRAPAFSVWPGSFEIGPAEATLCSTAGGASASAPELQLTASASAAIESPHRFVLDGRVADGGRRWLAGSSSTARPLAVEASGDLNRLGSTEAEITIDRLDAALGAAALRLASRHACVTRPVSCNP